MDLSNSLSGDVGPYNEYYVGSRVAFYLVRDVFHDYVAYIQHTYRMPILFKTEKDGKAVVQTKTTTIYVSAFSVSLP